MRQSGNNSLKKGGVSSSEEKTEKRRQSVVKNEGGKPSSVFFACPLPPRAPLLPLSVTPLRPNPGREGQAGRTTLPRLPSTVLPTFGDALRLALVDVSAYSLEVVHIDAL